MSSRLKALPQILSKNRTVIAIVAFLYLLPLGTAGSLGYVRNLLNLITLIMIFGLLAMSFDLQLGRSALLNFGHVALFGVGAYFMAYKLHATFLPPPYDIIAAIPYPLVIIIAMLFGAGLGLIMGLTTSRIKGTAFAFIALAIAMFIYNFFHQTDALSGGETGITVPSPDLLKTGPVYLLFVGIAFVFLTAFIWTLILYIKNRTDRIGLILVVPVMLALVSVLVVLGTNILGPVLLGLAFFVMAVLYWFERDASTSDPLHFSESKAFEKDPLTVYLLPLIIILVTIFGLILAFWSNIAEMVSLWIEDTSTYFFNIPVQYYLVLTCLVIVYVFTRRLIASPFGRMITAVAQNEERTQALGFNSYHAKIVVLVISGAIAGLAGALYTTYATVITPDTALGVNNTINAMLYTIIGGIGTLLGPLLGTGVVLYSERNLVDFIEGIGLPGQLWLVFLGLMYIGIVLFMPQGIVGSTGRRIDSFKVKLRQLKLRGIEFGLRDSDYWIFGLLGAMGLVLFMSEDARLVPVSFGIFGFLGAVGLILIILFRKEIASGLRESIHKRHLRRVKFSRFEFGLKYVDYGIFGLLGILDLLLFMSENARLVSVSLWIFEFLVVVVLLLIILYRKEIVSRIRVGFGRRHSTEGGD
ncbi:MAG: branched-chain amino acid ABC transporter permease [Candidatus Thorarchaeota archaeon]